MSDTPFSDSTSSTADVVTAVNFTGTTLTLTKQAGDDLTTTISSSPQVVTGLTYNVENDDKLKLTQSAGQSSIEVTIPSGGGTIYGFANMTAEDTINVQSGNPTNANPNLKGGKLTDLTVSVTTTSTDQDVLLNTVITGEWGMPLSPWRKGIIIERLANGVSTLLRGVLATGHTNNGLILSPFSINTWFGDADSTQENATASYVDSPNYAGVIQYTPILVNTDSGTVSFHINTTVGTGFGLEDAFSVSTMRAVVVNE